MYHTGADVLGVLIARAAGQSLGDFLRERIFEPLGMKDTGFQVPAASSTGCASSYMIDPQTRSSPSTTMRAQRLARPPAFAGRRRAWSRPSTTISPSAA